jgi:serine/threonine-protein phosphatase 2A regulatory subunit B''
MSDIVREMKLPFYWKEPLFRACGGTKGGSISIFSLGTTWKSICSKRYDPESQLMALLTKKNYLCHEDLAPLIMDIVETHPGLEFLRSAPEFHVRYNTVVDHLKSPQLKPP